MKCELCQQTNFKELRLCWVFAKKPSNKPFEICDDCHKKIRHQMEEIRIYD